MTNRYVIQGLLGDLVWRHKSIIVVGPTLDAVVDDIFVPLADELQGDTGRWGYKIGRLSRDRRDPLIETRNGSTVTVRSARSHLHVEGNRPDIWAIYGSRDMSWAVQVMALRVVWAEAAGNDAEIIFID